MPAQLICMSHGGLMNFPDLLSEDEDGDVSTAMDAARQAVADFAPDLVIKFGNDHNSGFSLRLMPAFLIALRARTLGDFGTTAKPLSVREDIARALVSHLHEAGVDIATSYDALFDHGIVMALDKLFDDAATVPVIPVFTNCGGDLRPPLKRSEALGRAIGAYLRDERPDLKVLFLGSGGLSHDPPLPTFVTAPPEVQRRMIEGTNWSEEALAQRTANVIAAGREHGRGEGPLQSLNPAWDGWLLDRFASGDLSAVTAQSDAEVIAMGGRGGSEIRNWIAACAALDEYTRGATRIERRYYRALPSWITGFGLIHASERATVSA
ncbi:2,3-dihydroxyphenylpropionate/2,3-dihydroxicinnamic acid 1,2-dioxygenase [Novosphingobium sediminis]|uniref:2,3-dihydroxyphenylpropionate/2,3-dihydroxicinnamic acid 1,2-dioxygenase n=1 Tax=Novosphingobium sediminis TaxID=707214 RepID=A0A512APJ6_9SPHN|nr:3-carboxyethylcatechol 2,3-dioxygenase [Novosphingobium sediminis]GEO01624.1 2,3-dihydroxyphenylpropionate/2,3-dihydroxicinnamic acid 1,2-dioxygenase [Novosphingobium sediminis]